ncbi:P-loop containing nucleoside triphosphate hydrolase protein [Mycena haematopus]|nr:P-loop containing nucleoside triphosphate hydrolase protein [Mycena haematopus]
MNSREEHDDEIPVFTPSTPSFKIGILDFLPTPIPTFSISSASSQQSSFNSGIYDSSGPPLLPSQSQPELLNTGPDSDDELWDSFPEIIIPTFDTNAAVRSPQPSPEEFTAVLNRIFGLDGFRANQLEVMTETAAGEDTVVLMPTGGGKSLCFQLPAVYENEQNGRVTIVVSPLRALIRDQVDALKAKGVHAVGLTSDAGRDQQLLSAHSTPALIYVTPEKLHKSQFLRGVLSRLYRDHNLARFVIDEAHCIETYGHGFRVDYQKLGTIRDDFPDVTLMALTAAVNSSSIEEIIRKLKLRSPKVFQISFNRPNLKYSVAIKRAEAKKDIVDFIKNRHVNEKGMIYCITRHDCKTLGKHLQNHGISAHHYHAGLTEEEQTFIHNDWKAGKINVIVATVTFGMGIDQPDVRFVIHYDLPKSLDNYYQETGRAGRDGLPADCILYYRFQDLKIVLNLVETVTSSHEEFLLRQSRREAAARAVVNYCQEKNVCRRVQLLNHFGEEFEEKNCRSGCDNCANGAAPDSLELDLSEEARHAVILVESFNVNENFTVKQSIDIFRGVNTEKTRKNNGKSRPGYGAGSSLHPDVVELLFDHLLSLDVLIEERVKRSKEYYHYYLKVGISFPQNLLGLKFFVSARTANKRVYCPTSQIDC